MNQSCLENVLYKYWQGNRDCISVDFKNADSPKVNDDKLHKIPSFSSITIILCELPFIALNSHSSAPIPCFLDFVNLC